MHGHDHHHQLQRCHRHRLHHHPHPHPQQFLPSTKTLHQWGFFLLIILPLYTTAIWCLLSRPVRTSLLQFTTATMVWSVNPVQSLILIHNENLATSYADGRTLTSQPKPCRCSKHIMTPSPPAYHVRTVLGERSLETSSGYVNMCVFQFRENSPLSPSSLLPARANHEVSPETINSSLVTVLNKNDQVLSNIDSLDDVSSIPQDPPDSSTDLSSSMVLPDPSPSLTYVRQPSPVLPLPNRPQISPRKKQL